MAYDQIAKWNRDSAISLDSEGLQSAVESMPGANCIGLPSGAVAINSASLELPVRQDLNAAVIGLLRAYKVGTPEALISYMRERGKTVNPKWRRFSEKALPKGGIAEPEKMSDEEQYRASWTTFKLNPHWSGLAVESSCRQFWNGKNVLVKRLQFFDSNAAPGVPPGQLEQAAFLQTLFRGTSRPRHSFTSTTGSMEDSHRDDDEVFLCDVQLVIELDETYSRLKAAYLFRYWFNPRLKKWQPQTMMGFATDPEKLSLPVLGF
jgi:hypothetical protein